MLLNYVISFQSARFKWMLIQLWLEVFEQFSVLCPGCILRPNPDLSTMPSTDGGFWLVCKSFWLLEGSEDPSEMLPFQSFQFHSIQFYVCRNPVRNKWCSKASVFLILSERNDVWVWDLCCHLPCDTWWTTEEGVNGKYCGVFLACLLLFIYVVAT